VGFTVDQAPLGQLLHTHHGLSSGAGTIGQMVVEVSSGLYRLRMRFGNHELRKIQEKSSTSTCKDDTFIGCTEER
jgi:hypothetical protein